MIDIVRLPYRKVYSLSWQHTGLRAGRKVYYLGGRTFCLTLANHGHYQSFKYLLMVTSFSYNIAPFQCYFHLLFFNHYSFICTPGIHTFFFWDLPRFFIWVYTFVLLLPKSSLYIKYLTWFSYLALFFLFVFQVCSWYILLYRNFSFLCGQTWFSGLFKFSIFSFSYLPHLA